MRISIYLSFKVHMMASWIRRSFSISNAWVLLVSLTVGSLIIYAIDRTVVYFMVASVMYVPLLAVTFYLGYRSGEFMHWYRMRYREKAAKNMKEGEKNE